MVVLAVAVLAVFAGGLYYITQNKSDPPPETSGPATAQGNGLPPKPTDRWTYIKELENRQVTNSPNSGATQPPLSQQPQLTTEQRRALEQIQSDMQKPPATQAGTATGSNPATSRDGGSKPALNTAATNNNASKPTTPPPPTVQNTAQAKNQRWTIQCGSFRTTEQAESVKVKLAFSGFESRISTGGGWNRVVMGPYANRDSADKTLQRLKNAGMSSCMPVAAGN